MKRLFAALLFLACAASVTAHAQQEQLSLKDFAGTYRGFSPTDESAVVLGEMEMTITDNEIKVRMATGHKIAEWALNGADLVPMSRDEVAAMYKDGSPYPAKTTGFRSRENPARKLLFIKDPQPNEIGLIYRTGGMAEILGLTLLYSPTQVARDDFEAAIASVESTVRKGALPRLSNGGKALSQ